jgi:hypothetical protein
MSDNLEWPKIKVQGISDKSPPLTSGLLDLTDADARQELLTFYREMLVPQLACTPDGSHPPYPMDAWLVSEPERTAVIVRGPELEMRGAWVIKENGIYYPCATIDHIALIYRALWDETIKHFDYVYGSTTNPTIMAFAQKAVRNPPSENSPVVTDERLEWRRKS